MPSPSTNAPSPASIPTTNALQAPLDGSGGDASVLPGLFDNDIFEAIRSRPYYNEVADAVAREAFYKNIEPSGDPRAFFEVLSAQQSNAHTRELEYGDARRQHLYPWVDLRPDGKLHGVYTDEVFDARKVIARELVAERRAARLTKFFGRVGAGLTKAFKLLRYNCEHSVPQSWFGKTLPERGDLHALFTSNPDWNSMRGHAYFSPVADHEVEQGGAHGRAGAGKFEPVRNKGAVARATLYFLIRYPGEIDRREMPKEAVETLLRWHREDPPGLWEKHRNAEIEKVQGNRNPFIDHPQWADHVDFLAGYAGADR